MGRNRCSRWPGIGVHVAPESAFTLARKTHQRETRNYVISILGSDAPVVETPSSVAPVNQFNQADQPSGIPTVVWLALGAVAIVLIAR